MTDVTLASFAKKLDRIHLLAKTAYQEALRTSELSFRYTLSFAAWDKERHLVKQLLDNPRDTAQDSYRSRVDYEKVTGLLSDIQVCSGLENADAQTQSFIHTFYNAVRGSDATSG